MRTTLDLDDRLMQRIRRKALDERKSLKEVINLALAKALDEDGARSARSRPYRLPVFAMGTPAHNLDKALHWADHLEDEAVVAKLDMWK